MASHAVLYHYTDDAAARDEFRADHRAYLGTLVESGELLASGPTNSAEGAGALLIMQVESTERVIELLDLDPFAVRGLVAGRTILEYSVVLGSVG